MTALMYLLVAMTTGSWANAEENALLTGNAIAKPETIERVVRMAVADVMKGEFSGVGLSFKTQKIDQNIEIPAPAGELKEILNILGIKNSVSINLSPIQAKFVLPKSALKIGIKKLQPNRFQVNAKWSITQLSANSEKLGIRVPKGLFESSFDIVSSPLQIGLSPKSKPITVELEMLTDLTDHGTKIHLVSLKTNINDTVKPDFFIKLGKLTVDGKPLEIEILSNGQKLIADEATIRAQFQQLEPSLVKTIRERMKEVIQAQFSRIADEIEGEKPIKFVLDSNELLDNLKPGEMNKNPWLKKMLGDMTAQLSLSYLQYVDRYKLFTGQAASTVCFNRGTIDCLQELSATSKITTEDLKSMGSGDDVGILIYESWLQSLIHSDLFQHRIANLYNETKSPGVNLSKSGVRLHMNPAKNAIVVVINLEIDIKKTTKSDAKFGKKFKDRLGDIWESWFGSGKVVKIPVEITAKIQGIQKGANGKLELVVIPELPFKNGTVTNTYNYPNNVGDMTKLVKETFLESVRDQIKELVDGPFHIPLENVIDINGFKFVPKKVTITPNHGLLVTAEMKN